MADRDGYQEKVKGINAVSILDNDDDDIYIYIYIYVEKVDL